MNVSALEAGHPTVPLGPILAGAEPYEVMTCPSLSFILQHSKPEKRVLFDLGIQRDVEVYPPAVLDLIKEMGDDIPGIRALPSQAVDESLIKDGTSPPDQIEDHQPPALGRTSPPHQSPARPHSRLGPV